MSARITLHCDTVWRESTCANWLITDAGTIGEARVVAGSRGWRLSSGGDFCPSCSGRGPRPAGAVVAVLHPATTSTARHPKES